MRYVVIINCFTMTVLYVLSRYISNLFGFRLMYFQWFSPMATNLHHTTMYLLPLSFYTLYFAGKQRDLPRKLVPLGFSIFFMYLAISTGATKAVLGLLAGAFVAVLYKVTSYKGTLNANTKALFLLLCAIGLIFIILHFNVVKDYLVNYFISNDIEGGRESLWGFSIKKVMTSPFVGYGYGSHVEVGERYYDAHNSLLTVLLQTGIIGLILYVILWVKLIKVTKANGYLFASNITILVYAVGGDILRRLPCWLFMLLSFFVVKNETSYDNRSNESSRKRESSCS